MYIGIGAVVLILVIVVVVLLMRNFSRWLSPVGVRRLSWRSPGWCFGLVG